MKLRSKIVKGQLPSVPAALISVLITVVWCAAAGAFSLALPGHVADLTAVYVGISLPVTITSVAKGGKKNDDEDGQPASAANLQVDSIELLEPPRLLQLVKRIVLV